MRICYVLLLLMLILGYSNNTVAGLPTSNNINQDVYAAISGTDTLTINKIVVSLSANSTKNKAYLGALKMKKSALIDGASQKLSMFRDGRTLLEGSIAKETSNVEYRLLRLMIQENCPPALGYSANKKEDAAMIRTSYNTLPSDLKSMIDGYSSKSSSLNNTGN